MLAELPNEMARVTVLSVLRKKVRAIGTTEQTAAAFERLVASCHMSSHATLRRARSMGASRELLCALSAISLRLLLITMQRVLLQRDPEAHEAAEALLRCLKIVAKRAALVPLD